MPPAPTRAAAAPAASADARPRSRSLPLVALAAMTGLHGLCSAMVAAVLPALQTQFPGAPTGTWVTGAFFLAAALAAPVGGRLADLLGARRVALGGLALIVVASLGAAVASSATWLVAARAVTGIGTAVQYPAALGLLRRSATTVPATTGLAVIALASEVAFASGPSLGAVLMTWGGWPTALAAPALLAALATGLVVVGTERHPGRWPGWRRLLAAVDVPGLAVFCALVMVVLAWLLALPQEIRWTLVAVLPVLLGLLWVWEREFAPVAFLPTSVVAHRILMLTLARSVLFFCCFYAIFYSLPSWLTAHGLTTGQIALVMLPLPALVGATCLLARRLVNRGDARTALLLGAGGLVLVAALAGALSGATLWIAVAIAAALAVPAGLVNVANQSLLYHTAPASRTSAIGGIYRTAQFIGGGVAAAVIQMADPATGMQDLALLAGAGALVLMLSCLLDRTDQHRPTAVVVVSAQRTGPPS